MSVIKAGYRLTVESWENDGDNHRSISKDGLTEPECRFLIDVFRLLDTEDDDGFGNLYEPNDEVEAKFTERLREVIQEHHPVSTKMLGEPLVSDADVRDAFFDVIHSPFFGYSEYYYTRVLESFTVGFVPQEINIEDVTKEFV